MKNLAPAFLLLSSTVLVGGCAEYFSVDEACPDKLGSTKDLSPIEADAMLRLTCHRRLAGVARGVPNALMTVAARDQLNYVLLNGALEGLGGEAREHYFLKQIAGKPGYTGTSVFDRLTDPATGVGYVYYDQLGSNTREYIDIQWTFDEAAFPLPSGADAIDFLMKDPEFRQSALQPSWLDGAYSEIALTPDWFANIEFEASYGRLPVAGRAYYLVVVHNQPHIEHADSPVIYPKEGQVKVPLYGTTHTQHPDFPGENAQTGFPITFGMGAIDAANFFPIEFNQYRGDIDSVSLLGPDGVPVEVRVLMPGDEVNGTLPDGTWMRTALTVYPTAPLLPSTTYRVAAEVSSPESNWTYDYEFTTVAEGEDPGVNPLLSAVPNQTTGTTTTAQ
jgi:hypothetical protein